MVPFAKTDIMVICGMREDTEDFGWWRQVICCYSVWWHTLTWGWTGEKKIDVRRSFETKKSIEMAKDITHHSCIRGCGLLKFNYEKKEIAENQEMNGLVFLKYQTLDFLFFNLQMIINNNYVRRPWCQMCRCMREVSHSIGNDLSGD